MGNLSDLTYEEAIMLRCACGKKCVGGWEGTPYDGRISLQRCTEPVTTFGFLTYQAHTYEVCVGPVGFPRDCNRTSGV